MKTEVGTMSNKKLAHKFALKKPCKNCPFTTDKARSIMLRKGRREQIIGDLMSQKHTEFVCHKTLEKTRSLCAGAVAVCRDKGRDMFAESIAVRLGLIGPDHYAEAAGFDNFELGTEL